MQSVYSNDFLFQHDSAPTHSVAHVQQLNCCVKKRQTFLRPTCGLQTDLSPVDYEIWAVMHCSIVSTTDKFHSVDELKRRLIHVWCRFEQSIFEEAILTSGEEDTERVSMLKDDILSTACELTMLILSISVTFNVTCLTVTIFECYNLLLRNQSTLAITFLFILQGSALADFRYGGRFQIHLVIVNFCL